MPYQFATLDPRPIPAATEANAKVLGANTLGIEVTVPALAAQCGLGNIDPQHTGGNAGLAAIEVALSADLPPEGAVLVTVRADLDSVGAMAILAFRRRYGEELGFLANERVKLVAEADKFARGGWPGVKPLPTRENPWAESGSTAESSRALAAIAAAVADFKVPLSERVATMERWIVDGQEPSTYREQVEKERLDMVAALESGAIKASTTPDGRIAVVESGHRAAVTIGYSLAPVVVALNPAFRFQGGEPHRKFTVSAFEAKYADIKSALAELAQLEPGWGGSPTIGGSPQGVSSALTTEQVVEVVQRHLK